MNVERIDVRDISNSFGFQLEFRLLLENNKYLYITSPKQDWDDQDEYEQLPGREWEDGSRYVNYVADLVLDERFEECEGEELELHGFGR